MLSVHVDLEGVTLLVFPTDHLEQVEEPGRKMGSTGELKVRREGTGQLRWPRTIPSLWTGVFISAPIGSRSLTVTDVRCLSGVGEK